MATGATIVGLVFVLTGGLLLLLLREPIRQPDKPASRWFALTVIGISLWPISLGLSYLLADLQLSVFAYNGRAIAAAITSVSWFLLAVEYTTRRPPSRMLLAAFGSYLLLDIVLTWTNGAHHLLLTEATVQTGTVLVPDYGPWFWARTVFNYGLIVLATALLVVEWNGSSGLQRRQSAILTIAVLPPVLANLLTLLSAVPSIYDLTPFGLAGSGILLTWALYRVEFLDVVPVARETAMEEMRDAVVTLDEENRVVDCNAAARDFFADDGAHLGRPAEEIFAEIHEDVLARFSESTDAETEVTVDVDGQRRHFSMSVSPVQVDHGVAGRVVVLRDVTPLVDRERALEERQQELDLLRQVLTRVLRHNLRNALTTIHGNAEVLADECDDDRAESAERIVDASEDLLAISDKAGHVERIASDPDPAEYDLAEIVRTVVADCRERYPDVSFETDFPDECEVTSGSGLEVAVDALVENAAEYGDEDGPEVTVRIDAAGPRLQVSDNGEGIPDREVAVLEAHEETPLAHGSGIGLWLAKWVADHAGATLRFDGDDAGTTVTMDFGVDRSPVTHRPDDDGFGTTP